MNQRRLFLLASVLIATASLQTEAITTDMDVTVEPKISSAFVWRGQVLNDKACFQPKVALQGNNLSLTASGNWDLTSVTNSARSTRVDITLDYSTTLSSNILSAGLVSYLYRDSSPESPGDTFEVYARDAVDVFLLPTLTVYYDFREIKGFYGTFSLAHSFTLVKDTLKLDTKATLGGGDGKYNEASFGQPGDPSVGLAAIDTDKAALTDLTLALALPFWRTDNLVFTPAVKYTTLLNSDIRHAADRAGVDKDLFYYSLAMGYSF